ncbi:unnamed protein product, partial [Dibothriocephalus latus]
MFGPVMWTAINAARSDRDRRSSTRKIVQEALQSNRSDLSLFLLSQGALDLASDSAMLPELPGAEIPSFSPTLLDGDGGGEKLQSFTLARRPRMLTNEGGNRNKIPAGGCRAFLSGLHLPSG